MRDHASLPVYKCELCDRTFSDSSNFTKHKKVHNLKVIICDLCGKKFQSKISLGKHIEVCWFFLYLYFKFLRFFFGLIGKIVRMMNRAHGVLNVSGRQCPSATD